MNKGKSLFILIAVSLLIGLVMLPAGITQANNGAQPNLQSSLNVYLPVILNRTSMDQPVPQGVPTQSRATKTPTKKVPTATRVGPTATRAVPTATRAVTSVAPTATRIAPTATRAAPTATQIASTATRAAPTATRVAPTATRIAPTATRAAPTATAPVPPAGSFTFLSWADTKTDTATLVSLSKQAKALNPAFTFYEGDLQEAGFDAGSIGTWKNALNGNASNGMFDITFPLRGNHDYSNTSGWQSYFNTSANAARVGVTNFNSLTTDLSYAFDYGNAHFIGIDITGDAQKITSAQITFIDNSLSGAEARGLTHAFVFFHGPIYPVGSHTSCTTRVCATPSSVANLVNMLNKHSIVSAIFNGHEHVNAYVHMDKSRVPEITHEFEQFINGDAGAGPSSCDKTFRFDACSSHAGFATITVSGRSYTVNIYKLGTASPVRTYTFTKP